MMAYLSVRDAKEQILDIGRRMYQKGFVAANDGNISCKIAKDVILATPTGVSKGFMDADMLVEMTLDGEILKQGAYAPSTEVKMHIRAYRENPEIMAVTHAHPPAATAFAIAGLPLDRPLLTEPIVLLGSVPVARYATPGTQEVPDSIAPFCTTHNAVLLSNHGALTWGKDLLQAFYRLESVEYYAMITMYTENILGKANYLSEKQIEPLLETRGNMGNRCGGEPLCGAKETNNVDFMPQSGIVKECPTALDALVERIAQRVAEKLK